MFKHLLLPLDGTATAERVIPVARGLARAADARITLLHVIEVSLSKEKHGQACTCSTRIPPKPICAPWSRANSLACPGVDTRTSDDEAARNVAKSLALHAQEFQPHLVVLCAHGSQWWKDSAFGGNLAQRLLQRR